MKIPNFAMAVILLWLALPLQHALGDDSSQGTGLWDWLTVAANLDAGYRRTQFFDPHYNTAVFQWDSRVELWLPPFRYKFSWGPFLRVAGIKGSKSEAWQNAWLSGPGAGFQIYPFSMRRFQARESKIGKVFGPLRVFGEYNLMDYWGSENQWRPRRQTRAGLEYWKASNVNSLSNVCWREIWNGLYWQSSNEFTPNYDTLVFANALRLGLRKPHSGAISTLSPYVAIESSRTKNTAYYWENRLLFGGGIRFSPSLVRATGQKESVLTRIVVYGEYLNTGAYYGVTAPSAVPRFEVRAGISANIGKWYR